MRQENVPALTIFSVCPGLINDVSRIESDRRDPNDCAKIPHDVTHAVDALRYYCSSRTLKTANATAEYEAAFDDPIWRTEIDADDGPEAGLDYALKFAAEL